MLQSWTWADHQVDDCFSLEPLCFPGEVTAGEGETAQLPDLVVGKLEDLFLVPGLADVRTPSRYPKLFYTFPADISLCLQQRAPYKLTTATFESCTSVTV